MKIDSIKNGFVIDHITAGNAMKIYNLLGLGNLGCRVALITNVPSNKMGKKDIIKIDDDIVIDTDILGFVDPNATVNIIKDEVLDTVHKKTIPPYNPNQGMKKAHPEGFEPPTRGTGNHCSIP